MHVYWVLNSPYCRPDYFHHLLVISQSFTVVIDPTVSASETGYPYLHNSLSESYSATLVMEEKAVDHVTLASGSLLTKEFPGPLFASPVGQGGGGGVWCGCSLRNVIGRGLFY